MIAVTRDLSGTPFEHVPLVDIAGDDGLLFKSASSGRVGIGCAAVVDVDRAVEELQTIERRNESSADNALLPLAFGCVDFLPGAPATLTIPELTIVDDGSGHRFAVVCADEHDVERIFGSLTVNPPPPPTANSFHVTSPIPISTYLEAVTGARDAVRSAKLRKAVIARPVMVTADHAMSIHAVLRRLDATFGSTYRFSIQGLVGASPELLVSVNGATVRSRPLSSLPVPSHRAMSPTFPESIDRSIDETFDSPTLLPPRRHTPQATPHSGAARHLHHLQRARAAREPQDRPRRRPRQRANRSLAGVHDDQLRGRVVLFHRAGRRQDGPGH